MKKLVLLTMSFVCLINSIMYSMTDEKRETKKPKSAVDVYAPRPLTRIPMFNDIGRVIIIASTERCDDKACRNCWDEKGAKVSDDKVPLIERVEPQSRKPYEALIQEIGVELAGCLEIRSCDNDGKKGLLKGDKETLLRVRKEWIYACIEYARFKIDAFLLGHYSQLDFTIYTKDEGSNLPLSYGALSASDKRDIDRNIQEMISAQRRARPPRWQEYIERNKSRFDSFLASKARLSEAHAKMDLQDAKEAREALDPEDLSILDDLERLGIADEQERDARKKEFTSMSDMLKNLCIESKGTYRTKKQKATIIIAGLEMLVSGKSIRDIDFNKPNFCFLQKLVHMSEGVETLVTHLMSIQADTRNKDCEDAKTVLVGISCITDYVFDKEEFTLEQLMKNKRQLLKVRAVIAYTLDPRNTQAMSTVLKLPKKFVSAFKKFHPRLYPKQSCCKKCVSLNGVLATAYCACVAGAYYWVYNVMPTMVAQPVARGWWE